MTFEEAYKYTVDMAHIFLEEEDGIAVPQSDLKTIYNGEHPIYSLMAANYPSLHLKEHRDQFERIVNNPIREQQMRRIRDKCLAIISLTGIKFINELETNQIDGIIKNSAVEGKKSQALRRELETLFRTQPYLWFCIIASSIYINLMVASSMKGKLKKLGTVPLTQTDGAAL